MTVGDTIQPKLAPDVPTMVSVNVTAILYPNEEPQVAVRVKQDGHIVDVPLVLFLGTDAEPLCVFSLPNDGDTKLVYSKALMQLGMRFLGDCIDTITTPTTIPTEVQQPIAA